MGHTLPSTTQLIFDQIAEIKPLYEALRRSDQLILDAFFEAILTHRAAIGNAANLLPMEILPIVISLEEHKRNQRAYDELHRRIAELENKIKEGNPGGRVVPNEVRAVSKPPEFIML